MTDERLEKALESTYDNADPRLAAEFADVAAATAAAEAALRAVRAAKEALVRAATELPAR